MATVPESAETSFIITLTDPCDPPTLTKPTDLTDQSYTITDIAHPDYKTQAWTISPDYCDADFTFTKTDLADGNTAVDQKAADVISAAGEITFAFLYSDSVDPAKNGESQTVTVTGTSKSIYGTNNAISDDVDFVVTFNNPCLDPAFVKINNVDIDPLTYTILTVPETYIHPSFTTTISPSDHTLCGDLEYKLTYNGAPVDDDDTPFAYSGASVGDADFKQITISSDDINLIDTSVPYEITAKFIDYPNGQNAKNADTVTYKSPCLIPETFETTDQTDPIDNEYTSADIGANITPFTVSQP